VIGLFGVLVDPRWYIDLKHPNRLGRVQSFLGLSPSIQRRVAARDVTDSATRRCLMVWGCWRNHGGRVDMAAPGNFLWRIRNAASDPVLGDLRASQAFVSYLIRTWQQQIVRETMPYLREPLFVPEQFFHRGDVDEVQAYKDFAAQRRDGPQDWNT